MWLNYGALCMKFKGLGRPMRLKFSWNTYVEASRRCHISAHFLIKWVLAFVTMMGVISLIVNLYMIASKFYTAFYPGLIC